MDKKKKYIGIGIGVISLALIIGMVAFKPALTTADEKDLGTIKQELKEELSKEYDSKLEELNQKLDAKESELKKAIQDGDKAIEDKINYSTINEKYNNDNKNKNNNTTINDENLESDRAKELP